ncbi:hypothetical protein [Tenacibaculum phage JQ]|nr:hypothetical protein [Tenacibaculum phage JQ]
MEIIIKGLPKHSLNEIYAGKHWSKRKRIKDEYKLIIRSQFKKWLPKDKCYSVSYEFNFKRSPLDVSNTVYMLKLIEDVIFEDDSYKIVQELNIKSKKSKEDFVKINIKELNN